MYYSNYTVGLLSMSYGCFFFFHLSRPLTFGVPTVVAECSSSLSRLRPNVMDVLNFYSLYTKKTITCEGEGWTIIIIYFLG